MRDPAVREDVYEERPVASRYWSWSPAQLIAAVIGIGFIVLGAVALGDTGVDDWYRPVAKVAGMYHTPLLAGIEIAFGVLMLLAALVPGAERSLMGLLSVAALVFGILIVADVARKDLYPRLGVLDRNGWFFIGVGAVGLLASIAAPVFASASGRRTSVRRVE